MYQQSVLTQTDKIMCRQCRRLCQMSITTFAQKGELWCGCTGKEIVVDEHCNGWKSADIRLRKF